MILFLFGALSNKFVALNPLSFVVIRNRINSFTAIRNMWFTYDVSDQAYFRPSEQVYNENTSIWYWSTESGQTVWRHLRSATAAETLQQASSD
jgi:hypothetical protein